MSAPADQDRARQVEVILAQVDSLPTLSVIATRLLQIANADDADLDQIVQIIEADPPLTAKLLGMCRRADKGLGDRITTVRRAVVMLGLEAVQAAVLSVTVYELLERTTPNFDEPSSPGIEVAFDREGFWKHSIAVGSACELISESHSDLSVRPEEAFVAGLLHDLGKMVLDVILPRSYARVLGLAERRASSSTEAEIQLIGLDHHTVGKRLAEHWHLPTQLRDAMWLHGQPSVSLPEGSDRNLIGIVGVARNLCRHLHLGWSGDFNHPEPLDGARGVCRQFGLSAQLVEAAISKLHDNIAHRCRVLGLGDSSAPELLMQAVAGANRRLGRLSAMYEQRSRAAARQSAALSAISEFHACCAARPDRSIIDTLAEVVRSASAVMGGGFFGVVYQLRDGEPWQLCRFSPDGRPTRSQVIDAPPGQAEGWHGGHGTASLASLTNPAQLSMGAMSLLPWLTDYLLDAGDLRNVQLLSLTVSQAAVVLLHDRESLADKPAMAALTATWAAAIAASAQQESARRTGERLAAATRSLSEAQQKLAETESLARLGEMAAGAAHEMNNPLTVICGRAQLLASGELPEADRTAASAIVDASRHLSDLITSLRLLADPPAPRIEPVAIPALLQRAADLAQQRSGIPGRITIDAPNATARLDAELIATALSEIILNALQASDTPVAVIARDEPGRLVIDVRDEGRGMSARALRHAFDPFFSEKPAGRATGLGLTRARRLAELHAGSISFDSALGRGTTCTLRIPQDDSRSASVGPKTQSALRSAA